MPVAAAPEPSLDHGYVHTTFVHFEDLDSMGMVHNCRYAFLLERALTIFWDRLGYTYAHGVPTHPDSFITVAEFAINYRLPVRGTGDIRVHFWVDTHRETSVVYRFRIIGANDETVHADGRRVHIRLDPKTLRPTRWAEDTREIYESLRLK